MKKRNKKFNKEALHCILNKPCDCPDCLVHHHCVHEDSLSGDCNENDCPKKRAKTVEKK